MNPDLDEVAREFRRHLNLVDAAQDKSREQAISDYRSLPPVTQGEMVLHSTGFLPVPQTELPMLNESGDDSACHCTLDELRELWGRYVHPDDEHIFKVYEQFPTSIPSGYNRIQACLRFAKLDGTVITELNGAISPPARSALVGLHVDGCYAIDYWGFKRRKKHLGRRDFIPSSNDFKIYRLICDH